ncbi:CHRD domain-containing protein, partial [bacterium]|nr:CHRD domain-containing protein [bacterium]
MSRFPVRFFIASLLVVLAGLPAFALETYRADLSGANEVPPNASPGTGTAYVVIDTAANTLQYHISYSGLTAAETAAHIHGFAAPGANAGVKHALPAGTPKVGTWTYVEADEANILAGLTYINIHTGTLPGGEIRGQIVPDPSVQLLAVLNGAQEVPPTASSGSGIGFFTIDTGANMLSYDIRYGGLTGTETAAHIHGFAAAGTNGGVVHGLPAGSPKIGAWAYAAGDEASILADLTYVNVHTTVSPGGESRGQIMNISGPTDVSLGEAGGSGAFLRAFPNPVRGATTALFYRAPAGARLSIDVIDVQGRVVRHLHDAEAGGEGSLVWDTRDNAGRPVATGVYFA